MSDWKGNLDNFCYVCGKFTPISERYGRRHGTISEEFVKLYAIYFDDEPFELDRWYVPSIVCKLCYNTLLDWKKTKGAKPLNFGVPMIWTEPKEKVHTEANCYACKNHVRGANKKKMKKSS